MSDTQQDNSFLNLSDEEIMDMVPPEPAAVVSNEPETPEPPDNEEPSHGVQEQETPEEEVVAEAEDPVAEEQGTEDGPAEGVKEAGTATADPDAQSVEAGKKEEPTAESVDYKTEYQKLLAPFKANGREIAVKNVDDAITLMQMGANYNKKMAALKPNLKLLKMLENNGLLDEAKLSYLIDLDKKNPDAINKLMQDSGLDSMDLDPEKAEAYKPSTYAVDEREVELDAVLDELQESPSYNKTLNIVSSQWDGASKQVIANTPQILKVINDHVQSGIYDLIHQEIEHERTFGRLQGLSDIEAYRQVGDRLHAQGAFNHLVSVAPNPGQQTPAGVVVPPKPKMGDEDKLREKKRAASAPKAVPAPAKASEYNPLSLSDEEFSKLGNPKFL